MIEKSFKKLIDYCDIEDYKGWDPYDGLNSKLFIASGLNKFSFPRLALIQALKRSPINLRKLLLVPKDYNSKGIALFLTAYCNLLNSKFPEKDSLNNIYNFKEKIDFFANLLITLSNKNFSGACWGYNFDWQNRVFFQPINTPTVVVTSFCADSLFNAYEVTKNKKYLDYAISSCNFIINDLNKYVISEKELIFSYSPLDNSRVYNASLLGARLLARSYYYSKNQEFKNYSIKAVRAIVNRQNSNGSWIYGEHKVQTWVDSFHTGFNLECIFEVMKYTETDEFIGSFEKGMNFYLNNFFLSDGTPKYYDNGTYPIDIHSPAQLIATLSRTNILKDNLDLAEKVLTWTIKNMQHKDGYFYYQIKRYFSSKISYMRWAQSWMFYAFSEYFKLKR